MRKILLVVLVFFPSFAFGQSKVKIPTLKACINASGGVNIKQKCSRAETVMSLDAIRQRTTANLADMSKCSTRTATGVDSTVLSVTLHCEADEFLLNHGLKNGTIDYLNQARLGYSLAGDSGLPNAVQYVVIGDVGKGLSIEVQGVCCKR